MSRRLKESVAVYGQDYNGYDPHSIGPIYGPFYCGMSRVMTMPQFNIKLLSPISTSVP